MEVIPSVIYHYLSIISYLGFHHSLTSYHFQSCVYMEVYTSVYLNYKFLGFHNTYQSTAWKHVGLTVKNILFTYIIIIKKLVKVVFCWIGHIYIYNACSIIILAMYVLMILVCFIFDGLWHLFLLMLTSTQL